MGLFNYFKFANDSMVVETWCWFKIVNKYMFLGVNYCMLMCRCLWLSTNLIVVCMEMWHGFSGFPKNCVFNVFVCYYWRAMTPPMKFQRSWTMLYVRSHISPTIDHVTANEFWALLLPMTLILCLLITFTIDDFLEWPKND
jgi:hypothetical protein